MNNNSSLSPRTGRYHTLPAQGNFKELEVTELYCPKCRRAVPVNKFLLLILPGGDQYEYRCRNCGTSVGKKTDFSGQFHEILRGGRT